MGTMEPLNLPFMRGIPVLILPAAIYINNAVLTPSTAKTITIPTDALWVAFGTDGNFWARFDGSAAVIPSTDITDGTGQVLNPTARHIGNVTTFSLISTGAAKISMEFYKGGRG